MNFDNIENINNISDDDKFSSGISDKLIIDLLTISLSYLEYEYNTELTKLASYKLNELLNLNTNKLNYINSISDIIGLEKSIELENSNKLQNFNDVLKILWIDSTILEKFVNIGIFSEFEDTQKQLLTDRLLKLLPSYIPDVKTLNLIISNLKSDEENFKQLEKIKTDYKSILFNIFLDDVNYRFNNLETAVELNLLSIYNRCIKILNNIDQSEKSKFINKLKILVLDNLLKININEWRQIIIFNFNKNFRFFISYVENLIKTLILVNILIEGKQYLDLNDDIFDEIMRKVVLSDSDFRIDIEDEFNNTVFNIDSKEFIKKINELDNNNSISNNNNYSIQELIDSYCSSISNTNNLTNKNSKLINNNFINFYNTNFKNMLN